LQANTQRFPLKTRPTSDIFSSPTPLSIIASLPQRASLDGIAPELRLRIYRKVAANLDKVSILGRKLSPIPIDCTRDEAADRIWDAVAKHPLARTSRLLRMEFNRVHRYHIGTVGVPKYILDLETYDMDRMGRLADLVVMMGPLLEHLRTKMTAEKFIIRFSLNGRVVQSVDRLGNLTRNPDGLANDYIKFKRIFPPGPASRPDHWSWVVILNPHDKSLSTAQKAAATSHKQEEYVRRVLRWMAGETVYGGHPGWRDLGDRRERLMFSHADREVASLMYTYHKKANAGFQAAKQEMHHIKVQNDIREKLRDELKQSVRQELQQIVREEVKEELRREMEVEISQDKEQLKQELKETIKQELKEELGKELMARLGKLFI
jgi:hypothetical protein